MAKSKLARKGLVELVTVRPCSALREIREGTPRAETGRQELKQRHRGVSAAYELASPAWPAFL